jgi:hypothetical protein
MRSGACCAAKASHCSGGAPGASAPTPQFAARAADTIGLSLNPPENALVLSVDEKPTIQALERAGGYVLSTHKKNDYWLAAHPNVTFHFTPTSASWLNQVEIRFGIFTRKALAGASFASIAQLVQAIRDFTEAYNRNAALFSLAQARGQGRPIAKLSSTYVIGH